MVTIKIEKCGVSLSIEIDDERFLEGVFTFLTSLLKDSREFEAKLNGIGDKLDTLGNTQ